MTLFQPDPDATMLHDDDGDPERTLSSLRVALKEATHARATAEEDLRETLAAMIKHQQVGKCGNFRCNTVTGAITGTEEVFKMFEFPAGTRGCTVEEWLVKLHPDHRSRVEQQFHDATKSGADLRFEYPIVLNGGETKYIRCDGEPDLGFPGELTYFGVLTDITERRAADEAQRSMEADLAAALRLASLGELAGSIIHEVNQPLAAIATSASACRRWIASGPEGMARGLASLDRIVEEGGRAAAIVSGLKSLIHNVSAEPISFDLNSAASEVCTMIMRELAKDKVVLQTDFALNLPLASGNPIQIQQIIVNLLRNSKEAMRTAETRILTVSTCRNDTMLLATVVDTGHGFAVEDAERIFTPLYTTKQEGMGLGLSISRKIALAHGGTLEAKPRGEGGAEFRLLLPAEVLDHD